MVEYKGILLNIVYDAASWHDRKEKIVFTSGQQFFCAHFHINVIILSRDGEGMWSISL